MIPALSEETISIFFIFFFFLYSCDLFKEVLGGLKSSGYCSVWGE